MRLRRPAFAFSSAACALGLTAACETQRVALDDAGTIEPSPNASILPAPLASEREKAPRLPDAGSFDSGSDAEAPTPELAREDQALPADLAALHDTSGYELRARFRWPDAPPPVRLPEANSDLIERARAAATFDVEIDLASAGRLNLRIDSHRFVLPEGTELRARVDYFGHALVWPDASLYSVIQPGALRTVLNEHRADTVPLARAKLTRPAVGRALGFSTERGTLSTPLGRLELEQARIPGSGAGGALLCRLLVELAGVHPDTPACSVELVPVRAEYTWGEGGRLSFEVSLLNKITVLELARLVTPPPAAEHRIGELPAEPPPLLLERAQLRSFRLKPVPAPDAKDKPKEGLLVMNGDDLPRFLLVDGVPALRLLPRGAGVLLELVHGTYALSTRTFLGDEVQALGQQTVPARLVVREASRTQP
jgi:hypothetical protein